MLALRQVTEAAIVATVQQLAHHVRVEGRAAAGHALDGGQELRHVQDPVLEQVAEAAPGHQVDGVGGLHVL